MSYSLDVGKMKRAITIRKEKDEAKKEKEKRLKNIEERLENHKKQLESIYKQLDAISQLIDLYSKEQENFRKLFHNNCEMINILTNKLYNNNIDIDLQKAFDTIAKV